MKTGMVFVVVGVIFVLCGPVLALEVLEAGRVVETYISYTCLGKPGPSGMVFDGYGNLYLSHWGDYNSVEGVIYCVNPYKQVVRFVDGLGTPRRMVWAGGTSYGEYLYVADCTGKEIVRVGLDGTVATVCRVSALPHSLVLDKTGTYGGRLFTATRGADRIYSISESGEVKRFSSFPGPIPGGHVDLTFDPGTNFGGLMYAALECDQLSTRVIGGVYCIDSGGKATRIAPEIVTAWSVTIDPTGLFGGELFISGKREFAQPYLTIWRMNQNGEISEFAVGTIGNKHLGLFAFGPDGALYVSQYSAEDETVTISRIY